MTSRKAQERVFELTALILAITLFFAALCYGATTFDAKTAPRGRYIEATRIKIERL